MTDWITVGRGVAAVCCVGSLLLTYWLWASFISLWRAAPRTLVDVLMCVGLTMGLALVFWLSMLAGMAIHI